MSKRVFSELEQRILNDNPNVLKVSNKSITYHPDFKVKAVHEKLDGISSTQIFCDAGFNPTMIGKDQPKRCLIRWRNTFENYGEEGLRNDARGKEATGRPSKKELTDTEKLNKAEARIAYLEAELEFLKKLDALERQAKKT